jgi:hypothetical protein
MMRSRCTISLAAVLGVLCLALDGTADTFSVTTVGEFQWALGVAAANGEADTINVAAGYYNLKTTGFNMLTYFPDSSEDFALTILGEGASSTAITDGGPNLLINLSGLVDTQANVTIRGIAFLYGSSSFTTHGGGGLSVRTTSAEITIEECDFGENGAVADGGGAYLRSEVGLITLTNCSFYDNYAAHDGGGLWAQSTSGMVTLTGCAFFFNDCARFGGGVFAWSEYAPMYFTNNTISHNSSGWSGGGVCAQSSYSVLSFNGNTFSSNDAPSRMGGGLYAVSLEDTVSVAGNTFDENTAADAGGAYVQGDTLMVQSNTFENNIALSGSGYLGQGGGLYVTATTGSANVDKNRFYANHADIMGGGLYADTYVGGPITLADNLFHTNTSGGLAGGVRVVSAGDTVIGLCNNVIVYNAVTAVAEAEGGGVSVTSGPGGTILLTNNTITGNSAFGSVGGSAGGGVRLFLNTPGAGTAALCNNIIWGNVAEGAADLWVEDGRFDAVIRPIVRIYNNDISDFALVHGDSLLTGGNIDADPVLSPEFHLEAASPCIEAGRNAVPFMPLTDFEGEPRIIDGDFDGTPTADIGADEYFPFTLTLPRVVIMNSTNHLPPLHPMSSGTMGKGAMSLWFMEPSDQMPRYWGARAFDAVIGPGQEAVVEFQWPLGNIEPTNDATIFWRFEASLEVVSPNGSEEFPVYAFPPGTQSPEKPDGPPLVELKGHGGMIDTVPLFGFASPGVPVGAAGCRVTYPVVTAIPVHVDIMPGYPQNPVNIRSCAIVPVAVLGTEEFDVMTIDPGSIVLSREGVEGEAAPCLWFYRDVAAQARLGARRCCRRQCDGHRDLVLLFRARTLGTSLKLGDVAGQTVALTLTGQLKAEAGGMGITGQDDVLVLKPPRPRRGWWCRRWCPRRW